MRAERIMILSCLAFLCVVCGGKAIVDPDELTGGAGGTSGSSSSSTSTSSSSSSTSTSTSSSSTSTSTSTSSSSSSTSSGEECMDCVSSACSIELSECINDDSCADISCSCCFAYLTGEDCTYEELDADSAALFEALAQCVCVDYCYAACPDECGY